MILSVVQALDCTSDEICQKKLAQNSVCLPSGLCSNPFQGGCLSLLGLTLEQQRNNIRVCNSDDAYLRHPNNTHLWKHSNATNSSSNQGSDAKLHDCSLRPNDFDYPEFRIADDNWESIIFLAWIYQIIMSEILGVPTTVGHTTGEDTSRSSFYSLDTSMLYNYETAAKRRRSKYQWIEKSNDQFKAGSDCSTTYEPCSNVLPEDWGGNRKDAREFVFNGTFHGPISNGQIAKYGIYIPAYTAKQYPRLVAYYGLQGEENRHLLAEIFKRPTSWLEYCEQVSPTNCTQPDMVAKRPPNASNFFEGVSEPNSYFWETQYTGYFRATEQNDCSGSKSQTCTGHISPPPCDWSNYWESQIYWNNIALDSKAGPNKPNGWYRQEQIIQIWRAANMTRSHVIIGWYRPQVLMQGFYGTDYEFQLITLPSPTDACTDARPTKDDRCSNDPVKRRGPKVSSCDNPSQSLLSLMGSSVGEMTRKLPPAYQSPAYEFIKMIKITDLDMEHIFTNWLRYSYGGYGAGRTELLGADARFAVCQWIVQNYEDLHYYIPHGYPRKKSSDSHYDHPFVITAQLFAVLTGYVAIIGMVLCWRYRDTKVMTFAQPLFVWLICFGFFCSCIAAALYAAEPTQPVCIAAVWFSELGLNITFMPILVRTAAINTLIRESKKSKKVNIKRDRLLGYVSTTIAGVVFFLTLWTVIDPPQRIEDLELDPKQEDVVFVDLRCGSEKPHWTFIAIGWELVILFTTAVLAHQTRNILSEFNESTALGLMVYTQFLFMVLRTILQVVYYLKSFAFAWVAATISFSYSLDALVSMCIYVFPKFYEARKNPVNYHLSKIRDRASRWSTSGTGISQKMDDKLNILLCTANIGNAEPTQESMEAWIPALGECSKVRDFNGAPLRRGSFDLIVIGMQESTWDETESARQAETRRRPSQKEVSGDDILNAMREHDTALLREMIQGILGDEYSETAEDQRGQMRLWIWASNAIMDDISHLKIAGANTGIGNVLANKGGIVITLTYKKTRISFLSAHLAAHEGDSYYKARCDNMRTILRESNTFWSQKLDPALSSHHMFAMGDLNFRSRFDDSHSHEQKIKEAMALIESKDFETLYELDELQRGLKAGDLLAGFETLPCRFHPTFKVQREAGFVYKDQRVPSYTDRILFRSAPALAENLKPLAYEPCVDFITSDHKPIRGAFSIAPNNMYGDELKDVDVRLVFGQMECANLPVVNSYGSSDPYLLFFWDSIKLKPEKTTFKDRIRKLLGGSDWPRTRYISRNLNPRWEDDIVALSGKKVTFGEDAMLFVAVMDANLLAAAMDVNPLAVSSLAIGDNYLGCVALNVKELVTMPSPDDTLQLVQIDRNIEKAGKVVGRMKLQVEVELSQRDKFWKRPLMKNNATDGGAARRNMSVLHAIPEQQLKMN